MCSFDVDESCEVYRRSAHTARKARKCYVCDWLIPAGAPYQEQAWSTEGGFKSAKLCLGCWALHDEFMYAHGSAPTPDWFEQALYECFSDVGDLKTEPDVKRWRDGAAGILRRRRLAA